MTDVAVLGAGRIGAIHAANVAKLAGVRLTCIADPNAGAAQALASRLNAQVAGIHTYGNRAEGTCDNFLRRVEWLPDPEKSMAAKIRRRD